MKLLMSDILLERLLDRDTENLPKELKDIKESFVQMVGVQNYYGDDSVFEIYKNPYSGEVDVLKSYEQDIRFIVTPFSMYMWNSPPSTKVFHDNVADLLNISGSRVDGVWDMREEIILFTSFVGELDHTEVPPRIINEDQYERLSNLSKTAYFMDDDNPYDLYDFVME